MSSRLLAARWCRSTLLSPWSSCCLTVAAFLGHSFDTGALQHWASVLADVFATEECCWPVLVVLALAVVFQVALSVLPLRTHPPAWLVPAVSIVLFVAFGNLQVLFSLVVTLGVLLRIYAHVLLAFLHFAVNACSTWGNVHQWRAETHLRFKRLCELVLVALVQFWALRAPYVILRPTLEKRRNRRCFEAKLLDALKLPFYAAFDSEFGDMEGGLRRNGSIRIGRSFSFAFVHTAGDAPASVQQLLTCTHTKLVEAREAWMDARLRPFEELPDCLVFRVRRSHIVEDTWVALEEASTLELFAPHLRVEFVGEYGVDYGGLALDWFDTFGQALVEAADDDRGSTPFMLGKCSAMIIPRPSRYGAAADKDYDERRCRELYLAGRFLALAVVHGGRPLPVTLSPLVCKYIIDSPIDKQDMRGIDPDFFRAHIQPLQQVDGLAKMEAAIGEPLKFVSVPTPLWPDPQELMSEGHATNVTEANLGTYLKLLSEAWLCSEIRYELRCLIEGFRDVIPLEVLRACEISGLDLAALASGARGLDISEWQEHTKEEESEEVPSMLDVQNAAELGGQVIGWFWNVVRELTEEQRRALLRFATGSGRLPPGGFPSLRPPFTLAVTRTESAEHLPHANTCVNRLVLPCYKSHHQLRSKLMQALTAREFGFA
eukprot:TRINITY_DN31379_c0_g1_i1.p1 TRINITY_DN31379_c0_g1~~TRINITY_DN31379_c0_g1_i1.p1  ORF type:complete len:670 (-),score=103.97 TRINITY_DN31379_c0_g1_i1:127-2103(-)